MTWRLLLALNYNMNNGNYRLENWLKMNRSSFEYLIKDLNDFVRCLASDVHWSRIKIPLASLRCSIIPT